MLINPNTIDNLHLCTYKNDALVIIIFVLVLVIILLVQEKRRDVAKDGK